MSISVYTGANSPSANATKWRGPNSTPQGSQKVVSGVFPAAPQTAAATGAGLPSPLTWLVGVIILLVLLKFLSEHESTALNPAHIHIGGYNVLAILTIALVGIPAMKILVNRPAFASGPLAGFASLVNST